MSGFHEYKRGLEQIRRKDYAGAERTFAALLKEAPNDPFVLVQHLYARARQPNRLIMLGPLRKALRTAPQDLVILGMAIRICLAIGKCRAAVAYAERGLRLQPNSSELHALRALSYLLLKDQRKGEAALRSALELNPNCPVALGVKSTFERAAGRTPAATYLKHAPESHVAHMSMAKEKLMEGDAEQGYWHQREALRLEPNSPDAMAGLVESLRHRNPVYNWLYRHGLARLQGRPGIFFLAALCLFQFRSGSLAGVPTSLLWTVGILFTLALMVALWPMPIVNIVVRLHPVARHGTTAFAKFEMVLTCVWIAAALVFGLLYLRTHIPGYALGAVWATLSYTLYGALLAVAPRIEQRAVRVSTLSVLWLVFGVWLTLT